MIKGTIRLYSRKAFLPVIVILMFAATAMADPTETKVTASDAAFGDRFGSGVAVAGPWCVIGAQANNDSGGDAGSAYVFDAESGSELRKMTASDGQGGAYFGCAVAAWGERAVFGALGDSHAGVEAGSAYIFDITDGTELHKLTALDAAEDDHLGKSVAICSSYALAGAYDEDSTVTIYDNGAAYLFDANTGLQIRKLMASDFGKQDHFGIAVAVSETYALVGAQNWDGIGTVHRDCGAVYVYDCFTGEELWWLTTSDEGAYDRFGNSVAVEGDIAVIGAYWDDNDNGWDAGAAYVFDLTTGEELLELTSSDTGGGHWFGTSVAVSGNLVIVGSSRQDPDEAGAAYVFDITTGQELMKLTATDADTEDNFGISIAIDGTVALVGADKDKEMSHLAGAAYIFEPIEISTDVELATVVPGHFITRNHPNPFNPSTEICLTLPVDAAISLGIYDIGGRLIHTLFKNSHRSAGDVRVVWDGTDDNGDQMSSGVYFYRVEAGEYRTTGKMTLLK